MKQIVRVQYNSDFTINNELPKGYDNQDFIIQLYTTDPLSYFEAKYIEGTAYNCAINDGEVIIYVNNHGLEAGCLHIAQAYDYDNTHFADGIENIKTTEETNVYLVKQNPNATSADYRGSALPDLTDGGEYVTQTELDTALADYVTNSYLESKNYVVESDLVDYATQSYVADYVATHQGSVDLSAYATKQELSYKQDLLISGINLKKVNGYSLLGMGNVEISSYVDLSPYVTHDELSQASYVTSSDLEDYVTEEDLNLTLGDFPTYTDVQNILIEASYVSSEALSQMGYITNQNLDERLLNSSYATETYVGSQIEQSQTYMETYVAEYVSQYAPQVDLSAYVTKTELNNAAYLQSIPSEYLTQSELESELVQYVTESELQTALSSYITESELSEMSYATQSYVNQQISNIPQVDLSAYVTYDFLSSQSYTTASYIQQYLYDNSYGRMRQLTASEYDQLSYDEKNNGTLYIITDGPEIDLSYYATQSYVSEYVNTYAPTPDLSAYVTKTELSNMGYLTSIPSEYITESELSEMSYATQSYVSDYVSSYGGSKVVEVTQAEYDSMQQAGTLDPNVIYIITDAVPSDLSYYMLLSYAETYYATQSYVADYVSQHSPTPDLSAYVTKTELNNAGYITSIPSEYITESELSGMSYATETYVADYVSSYAPTPDLSSYVTKTELNNAAYLQSVPSEYLTESELQTVLSAYITESELSGMSYATQSDLGSYLPLAGGTMNGNITFTANNTYELGSSSNRLLSTYSKNIYFDNSGTRIFDSTNVGLDFNRNGVSIMRIGAGNTPGLYPASNNNRSLGTRSLKWKDTYTYNLYTDSDGHVELPYDTYLGGLPDVTAYIINQTDYDNLSAADKNKELLYVISDQQPYEDNTLVTESELASRGYLTADNFVYDSYTGTLTINI